MPSLANKVVLVTNAATSLGFIIAKRLGSAGAAKLYLSDANGEKLNAILAGLQKSSTSQDNVFIGIKSDLKVKEERMKLFEKILSEAGRLDVAVLSAEPNTIHGDIAQSTEAEFDSTFSKYLTTPFLTCQSAVPLLEKSPEGGSVVLLTSFAGYTPFADVGLFSAAQTAQLGLCKAMAQSLAQRRIRVNSVCTGMLSDDGSSAAWTKCSPTRVRTAEEVEATQRQLGQLIPMGRVATSEDCAGAVAFLASNAASYVTGENVVIGGGVSVRI